MPRGDKGSYTSKQKRQAEHIEDSEMERGRSRRTSERIAWATVNKQDGGGKKRGSGRGRSRARTASRSPSRRTGSRPAAKRGRSRPARARTPNRTNRTRTTRRRSSTARPRA